MIIDTGNEEKEIKIPSIFDVLGIYRDNIEEFAFYKDVFSKEECKDIINFYNEHGKPQDGLLGEGITDKEVRDCKAYCITEEQEHNDLLFVRHKVHALIQQANERHFKMDLTGVVEPMQFLEYEAPSQHYSAHSDRDYGSISRKLSISILLSDPKDFEGGMISFPHARGITLEMQQGSMLFFPSFTIHEVLPVTKGKRNSLVIWATGPSFK
jgi:PKHD-type hydroxylase